ncbi:efflux RND transporter permease subunit [Calditrichota bacterium]
MNKIIEIVLKNRLIIGFLATLVLAVGTYNYFLLPVDAFPDVSPALVQVFTETEGLAPEDVEKYVTYPLEVVMSGLPNLEKLRSISNFGLSVVNIYFEDETDIYFARQLVSERLLEAREKIPEGFGDPQMGPIATGQGQILYYYLKDNSGRYSLTELRSIQDWIIKYNLQTVAGVTEVLGIGGWEKQYQVIIDPDELLRYNISLSSVIDRIRDNNLNVGAQYLEKNGEQFIVRSEGLAGNIEDLNSVVVKTVHGNPVYLSQLANVQVGGAIRRGLQTRNGEEEVVSGMVIKLIGTNSSTVIQRVEERVQEIQKSLPKEIEIIPFYEQKSIVDASVETVSSALLQGIGLVVLVLFLFMGSLRPSVVVALSIPFSLLFAFSLMKYFNISANLMSFGGLAIAIGMLVDGTIVFVENVDRMVRLSKNNHSKLALITKAFKEVGRPIIFSLSIIIVVFLPIFTLQGVEGKTFKPLAFTVAFAMLGSLIYAMFIAPVISSLVMRLSNKTNSTNSFFVLRFLKSIYEPVIRFLVKNRSIAVVLALLMLLIGALVFPRLGSEFTPRLNEGDLIVNLTFSPSISINETKRNILLIEKRFLQVPEVQEVVSRIGRGEVGAHSAPVNVSHISVILKPKSQWKIHNDQRSIESALREKLSSFPGVLTNITQPIQLSVDELVSGVKADLAIKIFGDDIPVLKSKSESIAQFIRKIPGATDIQVEQMTGAPQLVIRPDRKLIARYGLNMSTVQDVIHAAIGGVSAGQIFEGIRRFDINVRYKEESRKTKEAIENLIIKTPNDMNIPLIQLATIEEIVGQRQILRENNQRYISVQCNVVGRDIGSFVQEAQDLIDEEIVLPVGYYISWGGQFELQQHANKRLALVVPFTLLLTTLILYISFGRVKNSILIMLNIPLALVGGVVALWLTGQNLSVPASIGFIALFGIALENGMVMVTYLNQLINEGFDLEEASVTGALMRMRPVLITAITTALGLIPLLLATGSGSEVQRPLGTVVVGGLITSTILTLLIIPAIYKWFVPALNENNANNH